MVTFLKTWSFFFSTSKRFVETDIWKTCEYKQNSRIVLKTQNSIVSPVIMDLDVEELWIFCAIGLETFKLKISPLFQGNHQVPPLDDLSYPRFLENHENFSNQQALSSSHV